MTWIWICDGKGSAALRCPLPSQRYTKFLRKRTDACTFLPPELESLVPLYSMVAAMEEEEEASPPELAPMLEAASDFTSYPGLQNDPSAKQIVSPLPSSLGLLSSTD